MHVNFLENVYPIDQVISLAAKAGYNGVELRGWDTTNQTAVEDYIDQCCKAARKYELDLVFGCPNNTQAEHRDESMRKLKTIIQIAGRSGVRLLNVFSEGYKGPQTPYHHFELNGSALASEADFERAGVYFNEAGKFAAEHGISLCFETHNCYLHDIAEPVVRLLTRIDLPNVRANFDYGNIFLNRKNLGFDRETELLAPWIGYVHLKNVVAYNQYDSRLLRGSALADGDINNLLLMRKIMASGYRGPITIENIMPGDKRRQMHDDLAYLKSLIAETT